MKRIAQSAFISNKIETGSLSLAEAYEEFSQGISKSPRIPSNSGTE
jgi:hypothetical protein